MVIYSLLSELNVSYSVGLDPAPSLDRCTEPVLTEHGTGRTVIGGGSHMGKIAKVLTAAGKDVVDFSFGGWRPTKANIDRLASSIAAIKLSESNTVLLDLCSNSAYMGTDPDGLPVAAEKIAGGQQVSPAGGPSNGPPAGVLQNPQGLLTSP